MSERAPTEPPPTDHGPWLVVGAYILLVLTLTSIFIKLFTRYKTTSHITGNDISIILSGVGQAIEDSDSPVNNVNSFSQSCKR